MAFNFPRSGGLILAAAALALAAGCARDNPNAEEFQIAREMIVGGDGRALERADAEAIYNTARGFLESGDPRRALDLYDEIQARYPFSDFATQAELESIYANYKLHQSEAALATADRFIKQHPRHPYIPYVYYLRGLVNYSRIEGNPFLAVDVVERDTTHLRQAFTDFNLLIRNFPDSIYNHDARLRMVQIKHMLAAHELAVAEYYLDRRAFVAASRRAEYIIEHYQGANAVPRALEILETAYRRIGLENLAQDARAVLQASYPNYILHRREFYRQQAGLEPRYELPPLAAEPGAPRAADADKDRVSQR